MNSRYLRWHCTGDRWPAVVSVGIVLGTDEQPLSPMALYWGQMTGRYLSWHCTGDRWPAVISVGIVLGTDERPLSQVALQINCRSQMALYWIQINCRYLRWHCTGDRLTAIISVGTVLGTDGLPLSQIALLRVQPICRYLSAETSLFMSLSSKIL